jgi:MFS family permease
MLTHVCGRIHIAIFPTLRNEFNLSLRQLGLIAAIPPLCQALLSIPSGLIIDKIGSKRMILVSFCVSILGIIIASQSINPIILTVAISLFYVNTTIYHSSSYSLITNLFSNRDISKAIGIQNVGDNFGKAIGSISASILMGLFFLGWRQVYLFWTIPMLLGIVGVLSIRTKPLDIRNKTIKESEHKPQSGSMFNSGMVFFLLFISVWAMAQQMLGVFIPVYLVDEKGLSDNLSSFIYGSSSMMGIIGAPMGGFFASKIGEKKWLLIVLSLACASLGLALVIPNVVVFIILYLFYGFSNTLAMSARSALMAWFSPSDKRGLGYSLYFLPGSIMGILAPILAATVAETFGFTSIFYVTIAINIVGLVLLKFGINIPNQTVE